MTDQCPICKSKNTIPILYGYPDYTEELQKEVKEGKIMIGGCLWMGDSPTHWCKDCDKGFGKMDD
jgi:hypothetical protein